ncbi:MAG: proline dehydrogenase [Actinobacteria bacterium]|nr:MAG: proline dehydrogenase [Actinomycetota bacterium]
MLRSVILAAAQSSSVERFVATAPLSRTVVRRFVPGTTTGDVLRAARDLTAGGLRVTIEHLGEDTVLPEQAEEVRDTYLDLISALAAAELATGADLSLKLSALGQRFDEDMAYDYARAICRAAQEAGATVTLDMEDHTTTDSTLDILTKLRADYPTTGVALQAYLRRTEADCRELATAGSRVRLCKGAYKEPESVAYQSAREIDRSYVRCLKVLLAGEGYPMFATHDPRLIAIAVDRARWYDRGSDEFEFQMVYGVRPEEQLRLAGEGHTVRVYLPYGPQWFGYLIRRFAERPANLGVFARALLARNSGN